MNAKASSKTTLRSQITIREVAEKAGVSQMTVSRVLNQPDIVKKATRDRVEEAIQTLGYKPNIMARSLAGGRSLLIGLLYNNPSHSYLTELLLGALQTCREAGHHLVIEEVAAEEPLQPEGLVERARDSSLDAMMVVPPLSENSKIVRALRDAQISVVLVAPGDRRSVSDCVAIDDEKASAAMVRHLVGYGHERIAFIGGPTNHKVSVARHRGYRRALTDASLPYEPALVAEGDFTYRSGMQAADRLVRLSEPPTAIFASNDDMAAGAVAALHRVGLHVPEHMSVAGFDDTAIAKTVWPRLTTVRQPIAKMAMEAVRILDRRQAPSGQRLVLDVSIVERESVTRPRSGPLSLS